MSLARWLRNRGVFSGVAESSGESLDFLMQKRENSWHRNHKDRNWGRHIYKRAIAIIVLFCWGKATKGRPKIGKRSITRMEADSFLDKRSYQRARFMRERNHWWNIIGWRKDSVLRAIERCKNSKGYWWCLIMIKTLSLQHGRRICEGGKGIERKAVGCWKQSHTNSGKTYEEIIAFVKREEKIRTAGCGRFSASRSFNLSSKKTGS